jgi:small subunit ribosomal protein S24e
LKVTQRSSSGPPDPVQVNILVDIKILNKKENPLLHRVEIEFEIEHFGAGSPNRIEVRDKLSAMLASKSELTFIRSMQPLFGMPQVHGMAHVYEDAETAEKIEPTYIKIRNMPKDDRSNAWKEEKARKKKKKKK